MNRRHPNERPFSIIFALDEFKCQYKSETVEGESETVSVPIEHVAIFSSALSHCGGAIGTGG